MDSEYKEINFNKYCNQCKYKMLLEVKDPCNECLEVAMREGTEVPEKYEKEE